MGSNQEAIRGQVTRKPYTHRYLGGAIRMGIVSRINKSIQRGQELVEFAIVLPLLLIIVIGLMDLGRAFHASITIANASRAGVRYAVSFGYVDNGNTVAPIEADIKSKVVQEAQNSGITIDPTLVDIDCSTPSCNHGIDSITVSVSYDFPLLFNSIIGNGLNMTHATEMKIPW